MVLINTEDKRLIFEKIKKIFDIYNKLIGCHYLFITDSNKYYDAEFNRKNFAHLIGVSISTDPIRFYDNLKNNTLSYDIISDNQIHDLKTINKKCRVLKEIDLFLENKLNNRNIIIDDFHSLTVNKDNFLYSLRNDASRFTLVFSKDNYARSIRYELSAQGQNRQRIIFILKRKKNEKIYKEIIYNDPKYKIIEIPKYTNNDFVFTANGYLIKTQ